MNSVWFKIFYRLLIVVVVGFIFLSIAIVRSNQNIVTETVKEDLKAAQDAVTEKANELVNTAKAKFEELKEEGEGLTEELDEKLEEVKEEVSTEVDEVEKDIDDLLKDLDNDELKL